MVKTSGTLKPQSNLKEWCQKNGYDGVTQECVMSAYQSQDPKIQQMAKEATLKKITKKTNQRSPYGR